MKKVLTTISLVILINISAIAQSSECNCYVVQELNVLGTDSMQLILSNTCSWSVYLNLYVISTITPFDTLGRQQINNAVIQPWNTNISNILHTSLLTPPSLGTYRVSIENGTLICDSLQFSSTMSISDIQDNNSTNVYPNPLNGYISITVHKQNAKQASFLIRNILGQTVFSEQENNPNSNYKKMIELSKLENGIYLLDIIIDGERTSKKIVKE